MNQRKNDRDKKIRKLLLISSDIEMQKKIKSKKFILINSMNPIELENLFQLYKGPINTSISTYTNILEKHIVKKIVDIHKNIYYYYSDERNDNKNAEFRRRNKYQRLYSARNFIVNYDNLIDEEKNEKEKENKEEIVEKNLIPFVSKKKSVGEEKIKSYNSNPLTEIGQNNLFKNINKDADNNKIINNENNNNEEEENNNNNKEEKDNKTNSSFEYNSNKQIIFHHKNKKHKSKKVDANSKLIYYCYTYLKRKRPLIIKKSNSMIVSGLEIEEEFYKSNKIIKEKDPRKKFIYKTKKCKSSKEVKGYGGKLNSVKKNKKERKKINSKEEIKNKKVQSVTSHQRSKKNLDYQKIQPFAFDNASKALKSIANKIESINSEKKNRMDLKRLSQRLSVKKRANSIIKKTKTNKGSNSKVKNNNCVVLRKSITHIISKAETKTSSFGNISSEDFSTLLNKNEKRSNNIHLHKKKNLLNNYINNIKINNNCKKEKNQDKNLQKNIEKIKNEKKDQYPKRRKFKFITYNKIKREEPEETKIKEILKMKKHKKTTNEPIGVKLIENLKKYIDFDLYELSNIKNNKKTKNDKPTNLKAKLGKTKSMKLKKKDLFYYEEENVSNNDLFFFKKV